MRDFSPTNLEMIRTLFADLTPFAPIMSATLRNDLGEESNFIFRNRQTINHPVNFTRITEALDVLEGIGHTARSILHSWIDGIYDQNSTGNISRRFELPKDLEDLDTSRSLNTCPYHTIQQERPLSDVGRRFL